MPEIEIGAFDPTPRKANEAVAPAASLREHGALSGLTAQPVSDIVTTTIATRLKPCFQNFVTSDAPDYQR